MEISERELRYLMQEVDDQHRSGMDSMGDDIRELHHGEGRRLMGHSRRSFLKRAGVGGAVITIGTSVLPVGRLLSPVYAQAGDAGVAAFAESVELAAVEAYKAAAASGKVTDAAVGSVAMLFASHHTEHGAAFGAAAGSAATGMPNAKLLEAVGPQLTGAVDQTALLRIAYDLENAAAATYMFALGALTSVEALQLTASILPIESQHAVVLGQVLGLPPTDYIPGFETADAAVTPADYPLT